MRWTLDQLRTLVAVAEHGTMSGAAVTLGYTTGAVSQQMAALTRAVGRPLFVRDGARLALSDDGTVDRRRRRLHVPGALPGKPLPDGTPGPSLYCAVIVKTVDAQTRAKTGINELLRD